MRATLYDALGISKEASADKVKAALRAQIRKYYGRTRDGHGTVEEALRFINHASRILTDPELRAQYDHDLDAGDAPVDERIAHVVHSAVARGGRAQHSLIPTQAGRAPAPPAGRAAQHPGLTERAVPTDRATGPAVALCVLFGLLVAAAIAIVTPADVVPIGRQVAVFLTMALLVVGAVFAAVHGYVALRRRRGAGTGMPEPAADLAILSWRRRKTVFLGTNEPQEDSSWVFRLRMAELERAKLGRTSEPRPWHRLAARLFDYGLWGMILAVPLAELRALGAIPLGAADGLAHALVAPIVIAATWVPVETLLVALTRSTPGKWLFGIYLQFDISDAYAERRRQQDLRHALQRAVRVWWQGVGCGVPLIAPVLMALAYERLADEAELPWDAAVDGLVTHGPLGGLNAVTGIAGLAAMTWLYGVAWHEPAVRSIVSARDAVAAAVPSLPPLRSLRPDGLLSLGRGGGAGGEQAATAPSSGLAPVPGGSPSPTTAAGFGAASQPIDPEVAALFAQRRQRIALLSVEGPRQLEAHRYRPAAELCREWAQTDLGNAKAWRCYGLALHALGQYRDAVAALRRAKQYDPADASIDADIDRSQNGVVTEFLGRRGR
jgi:hypothetical protein